MYFSTKHSLLLACIVALTACSDDSTTETTPQIVNPATVNPVTDGNSPNQPIVNDTNDPVGDNNEVVTGGEEDSNENTNEVVTGGEEDPNENINEVVTGGEDDPNENINEVVTGGEGGGGVIDEGSPSTQLLIGELATGQVSANEILFYSTDQASAVILQSNSGDADMNIFDPNGNEVCAASSTAVFDFCSDLENGVNYEIRVFGFSDSDFSIIAINTPTLSGESIVENNVAQGEAFIFIARDITAVNLISLSGDADLLIVDQNNQSVCFSNSISGFDSCNNVDGSNSTDLFPSQIYFVRVDGFSDATFELQSFNTETLSQGSSVESFVDLGQQINYFARDVSFIELTPLDADADLFVFDAFSNEFVCGSGASGLAVDSCSVPEGDYRISVVGFQATQFRLTVGNTTSNLGSSLNSLNAQGFTDYVEIHNISGLGSVYDDNPWTVFIPTNEAISNTALDMSEAFDIINNHIITTGVLSPSDLLSIGDSTTNSGLPISVRGTVDAITINGFPVTPLFVEGSSSILYSIDTLLAP